MNPWLELLIRLSVALIPGIVNFPVALGELNRKAKFLVFFKPERNVGFWIWSIAQIILPSIFFWYFLDLANKPINTFTLKFIIDELVVKGLIFVAVVNTSFELGHLPINIKTVYNAITQWSFSLIERGQMAKVSDFLAGLEQALLTCTDEDWQ